MKICCTAAMEEAMDGIKNPAHALEHLQRIIEL